LPVNEGHVVYTYAYEKARRAAAAISRAASAAAASATSLTSTARSASTRRRSTQAASKPGTQAPPVALSEPDSDADEEAETIKAPSNSVYGTAAHYISAADKAISGYRCCYLAPHHPLVTQYGKVREKTDELITELAKEFACYGQLALNQHSHTVGKTGAAGVYWRAFMESLTEECDRVTGKRRAPGSSKNSNTPMDKLLALMHSNQREPARGFTGSMVKIHKKTVRKLLGARVVKIIHDELKRTQELVATIDTAQCALRPSSDPIAQPLTVPEAQNHNSLGALKDCVLTRGSSSYSSHNSITFAVNVLHKRINPSGSNKTNIVLLLDQFSVHRSPRFRAELESRDISYVFIPSGMTSELQPLDLTFNDKFKVFVDQIVKLERTSCIHKGVNNFPVSAQAASVEANNLRIKVTLHAMRLITGCNIVSGFKQSVDKAYDYMSKLTPQSDKCYCGSNCDSTCPADLPASKPLSALQKSVARKKLVEELVSDVTLVEVKNTFFPASKKTKPQLKFTNKKKKE